MSDEELCKSLRSTLWGQGHHINIKAAARIEALTEQLEAARADAKEAEAYAEELEKERDRWREIANNEAVEGEANRNAGLALEAKLAKVVEALLLARVHVANNEQGWSVGRASARSDLKIINATLAEIEGSNAT
jgi:hypothetical protein